MGAKVEIFIDMAKYSDVLSDNLSQRVSSDIRNKAKKIVRIDSTRLRNSIKVDKVGFASYEVFADVPHALAQEFGRPDLPSYGYTPYLRPAAQQALETGNFQILVEKSNAVALKRSKK
jgi:hypothetical protein